MKVQIINKENTVWEFKSVKEAKPHIKKEKFDEYKIKIIDGKKVRVYDDRELSDY